MNKINPQSRLYAYQKLIGKYDLIDKYKFSVRKFIQLNSIKFFYNTYKILNTHLSLLIFKEFSMNRHFTIKNLGKLKQKTFKVVLRNFFLFGYLEFLLNSLFFKNKIKIINNNQSKNLNLVLDPSLNNNFFLHDKLNPINKKFNIILNFENKNLKLGSFLSYYFIPVI